MDLSRIESTLRQNLEVQSVEQVEGFPCADYARFIQACDDGGLEVLTAYNPAIVPAMGTSVERLMHNTLLWSPAIVTLALAAVSWTWADAWVLAGIPLAFLGFFLSTHAFMKNAWQFSDAWRVGHPCMELVPGQLHLGRPRSRVPDSQLPCVCGASSMRHDHSLRDSLVRASARVALSSTHGCALQKGLMPNRPLQPTGASEQLYAGG